MRLTLRGAGLAGGPHPHGSPGAVAERFGREDGESRRGRVAEEGEGGQEEDLGPHHHHPHPKGERPKGVRHHQSLPRKEGGAIDDVCAFAVRDGARGVVRWNDASQGNAPQLQDHVMHQGGDGAFVGRRGCRPRLCLPSAGASSDEVGARLHCLCKFPFLLSYVQLIS